MNVTTKKPLRNELAELQQRQKQLFAMEVETMTWDEYCQHQRDRSYVAHAIACAKQRLSAYTPQAGMHELYTPKQTNGNASY
jgi:hypothetical protein